MGFGKGSGPDTPSLTARTARTGQGSPPGRRPARASEPGGRLAGMANHSSDSNESRPADSAWHRRMSYGERLSARPLRDSPFFHFEGDLRMAALEPMLVPERPRGGELDPAECFHCTAGTE